MNEEYVQAGFVLIGLVNGIRLGMDQEWKSFGSFLIAIVAGTLFGSLHLFGLPSAEVGFAIAIGSSGVYKVAQKIGGI